MRPVLIAFSLAAASTAWAQNPNVVLKLGSTTMEVGEVVDAQLICTNTGVPDPPIIGPTVGYEWKLINPVPSRFSQQSWVNGRRTSQETYTYRLRVTARKVGRFAVGPIALTAGGRTYKTKPVAILILPNESNDTPRGDKFVFAEVRVSREKLYVTESFTATLVIGIRKVVLRGRAYPFKLLNIINTSKSELSIFSGGRASTSGLRLLDSTGAMHDYEVFRINVDVRAEEVGEMAIGPVFLRADYPTQVRRNIWGDLSSTRTRKELARADAVIVEVNLPPENGRPPSFNGAIGRYTMTVSASPTRVEQGQPITLTIALRGRPLEGLAAPDLSRHAELASRFEFTNDEMIGTLEQRAKVFRRAVFPRQVGEQTIPPIAWSYFDLKTDGYVTLTSQPIKLIVDPSSSSASAFNLAGAARDLPREISLTLLNDGISPNYVDESRLLASQAFSLDKTALGVVLLMPPLGWLAITLGVRHRQRLRGDAGLARRRKAAGVAVARIRKVQHLNGAASCRAMASALTGYLADRFDLPPGELTPTEVRDLLTRRSEEPALTDELVQFLELADAAEYAPSTSEDLAGSEAAARVRRWIKVLDRDS